LLQDQNNHTDGDHEGGSLAFGQVCGLIQEIPTCQELIDRIIKEAEDIFQSLETTVHPEIETHMFQHYATRVAESF
jgi:NAD(P)H-dependent flavin oxidoreductase YrpB (nitropropane dioxygenase family)